MQSWDKDSIQANWQPIDYLPNQQVGKLSPEEDAYNRFYGIDFEKKLPGISHRFGYQQSGQFKLATHYFQPKQRASLARVLIVHGYFDHAGLYGHLIRFCLERDCSVMVYDLPGHGLSTGEPGEIDDFHEYVRVLSDLVDIYGKHGKLPLHIIGQSTGCAIIMEYLRFRRFSEADNPFASILLLAPLVRPEQWKRILFYYRWFSPLVKSVKRIFMDCSHDREFLQFMREKDPLQHRRVPINWVASLIRWEKQFSLSAELNLSPVVIQGEQDTTIDWRYNMGVIRNKFNRPLIKLLPEARHHLVNESKPIREQVFSVLADFLPGRDKK